MKPIHEELEDFIALDRVRKRARDLRAAAIKGIASNEYPVPGESGVPGKPQEIDGLTWAASTDAVELALVLSVERIATKRLPFDTREERNRFRKLLARTLGEGGQTPDLRVQDLTPGEEGGRPFFLDHVPTLRCARFLHEFAARPGLVFDERTILCYYRVLFELYSTGHPDWVVGSARASDGGAASAFITNECTRAILSLRSSVEMTATFLDDVASYIEGRTVLDTVDEHAGTSGLSEWAMIERARLASALLVKFGHARRSLLFEVAEPLAAHEPDADGFVEHLLKVVRDQTDVGCKSLQGALERANEWRLQQYPHRSDDSAASSHRTQTYALTASAWEMATQMLSTGLQDLENAKPARKASASDAKTWRSLARNLRGISKRIHRTLRPAASYASAVLDREIAAHRSPGAPACDGPELVFAATAYGAISRRWSDPRLLAAARILDELLDDEGKLPRGRPFHAGERGYLLNAAPSEVTRALARLIQMVDYPLTSASAIKLLHFYEDSLIPLRDRDDAICFCADVHSAPGIVSWWASALAVNALDRVVRMLNAVIRRRVLVHFTTKAPAQIDVSLEQVVQGDYGLVTADWGSPENARVPLAFQLERMRAHLLDSQVPTLKHWGAEPRTPLWSAVLYGPPGTGKSTLMEALVKSAGPHFTLVTITPSDIVVAGMESLEMRARCVLKALSLLTDCVVLFDEFDPFIRRRVQDAPKHRQDVFDFITPGMLTKLRELHRASQDGRVVYALATNMIGNLDEAAIRGGRFDVKIGVYPPDVLSRWGSVVAGTAWAMRNWSDDAGPKPAWTSKLKKRAAETVLLTGMQPMTTLGRPGWLSRPSKAMYTSADSREATAFDFIVGRRELIPRLPGQEFGDDWGRLDPAALPKRNSSNREWAPVVRQHYELELLRRAESECRLSPPAPDPWVLLAKATQAMKSASPTSRSPGAAPPTKAARRPRKRAPALSRAR